MTSQPLSAPLDTQDSLVFQTVGDRTKASELTVMTLTAYASARPLVQFRAHLLLSEPLDRESWICEAADCLGMEVQVVRRALNDWLNVRFTPSSQAA